MRLQAFLPIVLASFVATNVVHERRYVESGLHRHQRVDSSSIVEFRIALKQTNLEYADAYLLNISHPHSPHYGKFWTPEEVRRTFAPDQESIGAVIQWLKSSGIDGIAEDRGWLSFTASVNHIEKLLHSQYYEHEDFDTGAVRIGCDRYHLPANISKHIDYVTPGVALSAPLEKRSVPRTITKHQGLELHALYDLSNLHSHSTERKRTYNLTRELQDCGSTITSACIRALYNIPSPAEVASEYNSNSKDSLGVFEQYGPYNQSDLDAFFTRYAPEIPNGTHPIGAPINGAKISPKYPRTNAEASLDLMEMYGLVYPQKITLYQTKSRPRQVKAKNPLGAQVVNQDFLDALDGSFCTKNDTAHDESCGTYSPARVVSISYGSSEILQPQAYLHRQCIEFMKLGLQGTTFTVSSGDFGVAIDPGSHSGGLINGCIVRENYNATVGQYFPSYKKVQNGTIFDNQFPAACPYVLSVGGTQLDHNDTVRDPEGAMNLPSQYDRALQFSFSSGGGFSNQFSRPIYQHTAIGTYFSEHDPDYPFYMFYNGSFNDIGANGGIYNRAGRGIPDVSANAARFAYVYDGEVSHAAGTSCAAPIWGSVFTLINEKRSQAGKGPVGFVNPTLYQHPEVFNDITKGNNPGCFTPGFSAVEGWDPITGLGTPNYPKLLDLFMSLP